MKSALSGLRLVLESESFVLKFIFGKILEKLQNAFQVTPATALLLLFKVINKNTRARCALSLKLTKKTPERRQWRI